MKRGNNEEESFGNMPSIRLKYKGGKNGKSKINYGVVKESSKREISSNGGIKEEKIVLTKESKSGRGIAAPPIETSSKITKKTVVQGGDTGKSSQKITITKTEITEQSKTSRAVSGPKDGKGSIISKTTEKTITSGNNRNSSQGRSVKEEITTKTTTTTTNQGGRGRSSGKEEVVKTVTSTTTENTSTQRRVRGGDQAKSAQKEEMTKTETTTTTTNQRQRGRGESQGKKEQVVKEVTTSTSVNRRNADNQKQVTTTKTVTKASVGQESTSKTREKNAAALAPSQTTQIKVEETGGRAGRSGRNAKTEQKSLIAQKSVPALRGNKEVTTKTTIKEEVKRPYSSKTEVDNTRDNITRITIDDTGKIPKKTYVLNVRKLDRIQQNKRQRLTYSSNLEKNNPITTNFNHNIIIIKNVKELPANYSSKTNIPNTVEKIINESGKIQIKRRAVSPRRNEIIKSFKKPLKLTYENYVETNTSTSLKSGIKQIPLPASVKKTEITKINIGDKSGSKTTETRTSRIRAEGTGNKTTTTTTTTTTETKTRLGRNKSEANMNRGGKKESKVTVTKTEISMESKGGKGGRLQISRSGRNISENSGSTSEKKATVKESSSGRKVETTTTKEVITQRSGSKNREGGEGSKVTMVKKTEITTSSTGENGGRSRSRVKQETSSTTTTSTTKTVTKTSSKVEPKEGGGVVKKFRSMRHMKK